MIFRSFSWCLNRWSFSWSLNRWSHGYKLEEKNEKTERGVGRKSSDLEQKNEGRNLREKKKVYL
jgi:hypothetical protein